MSAVEEKIRARCKATYDRELRDEWLPRPFAASPPEYYTGLVLKAGQMKTVARLFREHIETERKERT